MNKTLGILVIAMLIASVPAAADDLSGSNRFLCSSSLVTRCDSDGECTTGLPWTLNIPSFIEIDMNKKTLAATQASGQNRSTPITHSTREDGQIILQGAENGRAFSFVITEATGRLAVAVATGDSGVSVFGACTPITSGK